VSQLSYYREQSLAAHENEKLLLSKNQGFVELAVFLGAML